jgi:hypothetical protein
MNVFAYFMGFAIGVITFYFVEHVLTPFALKFNQILDRLIALIRFKAIFGDWPASEDHLRLSQKRDVVIPELCNRAQKVAQDKSHKAELISLTEEGDVNFDEARRKTSIIEKALAKSKKALLRAQQVAKHFGFLDSDDIPVSPESLVEQDKITEEGENIPF